MSQEPLPNRDNHQYLCEGCGRTCTTDWTEEEANQEALERFGLDPATADQGMALVCDDCFQQIILGINGEEP